MQTENFYKYWVNESVCEPEEAASLILGLNPELTTRNNPYIPGTDIIVKNLELKHLAKLLGDYRKGIYSFNIFTYTDLALANNYELSFGLRSEIKIFIENLLSDHQAIFGKKYPYIARLLMPQNAHDTPQYQTISTEKKHGKFREVASVLLMEDHSLSKELLVQKTFDYLKSTDPKYIKHPNGRDVSLHTFKRILNFKELRKRLSPKK